MFDFLVGTPLSEMSHFLHSWLESPFKRISLIALGSTEFNNDLDTPEIIQF